MKKLLIVICAAMGLEACALFTPKTYEGVDVAPGEIHAKDLSELKDFHRLSGDPMVVVDNRGAACMTIVAEAGGNTTEWAAKQLQATILEMTGVKLNIIVERKGKAVTNAPAFYIGKTTAAQKAGLKAPTSHKEAFRVVAKDGSYYFLGVAPFAVTDFCERHLGARFYWPHRPCDVYGGSSKEPVYGKCVETTHGLAVLPMEWTDQPVFAYRDNWPYEGTTWNRWSKGGNSHRGGVSVHAPHGWWKEKDATNHVEIFSLTEDGKRPTSPLLCYGNPKTLEYYKMRTAQGIEAYKAWEADTNPKKGRFKDPAGGILAYGSKVVTISQWDCGVVCACEYCKKLFDEKLGSSGSGSPIIWGYFTKQYAKWLKEKYPEWKIGILPYINTCDVPPDPTNPAKKLSLREEGNVEAMLCTMPGLAMMKNKSCKEHEENLIRQWEECTGNPVLNWHYSCWPCEFTAAPYVYGETIYHHYQDMRKNLVGSFLNGGYDITRFSLSVYVWMRCLWNPDIDVQAIYDGFARRMFGKAEKPMRKLIAMQEAGWNRQWGSDLCSNKNIYKISYPRNEVLEMIALFEEAEKLAAGDGKALARIKWYKSGFTKFFKESEENASGNAFLPHLMKKAMKQPVIDGKLDDACWDTAEPQQWVSTWCRTNSTPKYKTESRIVWYPGADGGVTFGFRFEDPASKILNQGVQGDFWGNDNFEVYLDISGSGDGHYYRISADCTCRTEFTTDGPEWKPQGIKVAKFIGEGFWSIELFVPFADIKGFPKAQIPTTSANGCVWTGNFCRLRVGDSKQPKEKRMPGSTGEMSRLHTRFSAWNKDPAAFGEFRFVE